MRCCSGACLLDDRLADLEDVAGADRNDEISGGGELAQARFRHLRLVEHERDRDLLAVSRGVPEPLRLADVEADADDLGLDLVFLGIARVAPLDKDRVIEQVHIVDGAFVDFVEPSDFEWDCLQRSYAFAESQPLVDEANRKARLRILREKKQDGQEMIDQHDLRVIMPEIFGGEVKTFKKGYIMMQCPFHSDSVPSCYVDKEKYFCKSCHAKGNWWSLKRMGYVDFPKKEFIRVKTLEKVKI